MLSQNSPYFRNAVFWRKSKAMDYVRNNSEVYSNRNIVRILNETDLQTSCSFAVEKDTLI